MWCWRVLFIHFLLKCLPILWRYKHIIWLMLIIDGLWRRNKGLGNKGKGFCQPTFRLVLVSHWLRNLQLGNVCGRNVCIRIGNTGNEIMAGNVSNVYLCLYSDLLASCPVYLCRDMEILGFLYKIRSFHVLIDLYIRKFLSFRLSRKQASSPLVFPTKQYTLVYFVSKASLLDNKSYKKYQCINLFGLAPWERAYIEIRPFSSHNGPDWRELRPLVTPWTWPIKQGNEPWKCQIGFSCLMSKVSFLPCSLLSFSCSCSCFYCYFICILCYVLVKGKNKYQV